MAKGVARTAHPTLFQTFRTATRVDPPNLRTADCPAIVGCDDTCDYAIKDAASNPLVPHAEWFCTHLAELVGIACPDCQVIKMPPDGRLVFGSRWEGGVLPALPPPAPPTWVELVRRGLIPLADICMALSRIYAFDHFIHNTDRHAGNFLIRQNQARWAVLAFDFSRAWTYHGFPLPAVPFDVTDPNERTIRVQRQLSLIFGTTYINSGEAFGLLETIGRVPKYRIEGIIKAHPREWLPLTHRKAIMDWWKSKEMMSRIDQIATGISNGSFL
jgi:hypothetical protein